MSFSASGLAVDTMAEISSISTPGCQTKPLPGTCKVGLALGSVPSFE